MKDAWASNPDFWKQTSVESKKTLVGIGLRPKSAPLFNKTASSKLRLETKEELQILTEINFDTKVFVQETDCWFQYSKSRNLWIQVGNTNRNVM